MNKEQALKFKTAVDRRLAAEGIPQKNRERSIKSLSVCVMGSRLAKAYNVLYGVK